MDSLNIRHHFPIFKEHSDMIYFDNAATTQKPKYVIDAISNFYTHHNFNVHRSVYTDAGETTEMFEQSRQNIASFINASSAKEIVFSAGTTDSINLIANGYYAKHIQEGDEIVVSIAEHHSNLLPWQKIAKNNGATLKFIPLNEDANLDLNAAKQIISDKTKLVAVTAVSNVLGNINPIDQLTTLAHEHGADILVDGAQAAPELPIDVQETPIDWLAFSGHKMMAPTGIGVLYGKQYLLENMDSPRVGGEMIESVSTTDYKVKDIPYRLEAGTPNIEGVIGLDAAISYLKELKMTNVQEQCEKLGQYLYDQLNALDGVSVYGPTKRQTGIVSFNVDNIHPHDAATFLDSKNIDVRAGQHCAEPLTHKLGVNATLRASLYIYNTIEECNRLVDCINEMKEFFNGSK
ncbi:Cysteine desulfurase [Apilactobacillus kunkeei]|uniref:aminotransferase class V-fold PLP-dependent enzyme n=1 Tax=Apilactobacillus kunkeei TaxID=148814 RepID=UPI0006B25269|nr:cysteine desulfurase [Apilactobacillus kunkeei]KOY78646.1 Cysteine desulfurase [Apilactobacillus kunkeei]